MSTSKPRSTWKGMTVDHSEPGILKSKPSSRLRFRAWPVNRDGWVAHVSHPQDNERGSTLDRILSDPFEALDVAYRDYLRGLAFRKRELRKKLQGELKALERFEKAVRKGS